MVYDINTNYLEIIAGTSNTIDPVYREAAENVAKDNETSLTYLKNFITNIETIAAENSVKDDRISRSRGNIENFSGYKSVKDAMDFLQKHLKNDKIIHDCLALYKALNDNKALYIDGYDKQVRLVILEYENALYLLVTSLSMLMATSIDPIITGNAIVIKPAKNRKTFGIIPKTLDNLASQLTAKDHKAYLEEIIKASEAKDDHSASTGINESVGADVSATITTLGELIDTAKTGVKAVGRIFRNVKNTVFGVVPLIRSIIYLRYKKKADTIKALEEQVDFINKNIEQLQKMKTADPAKKAEVIKRQTAVCEAYKKKAEKLRAELCETEKAAATDIKKSDSNMGKTTTTSSTPASSTPSKKNDDDFVLESTDDLLAAFND